MSMKSMPMNLKCWLWPDHEIRHHDSGKLRKSHNLLVNKVHALLTEFRDACRPTGRWIDPEDETSIDGFVDEGVAPPNPGAYWEPYTLEEQQQQLQDIADKCDAILKENA